MIRRLTVRQIVLAGLFLVVLSSFAGMVIAAEEAPSSTAPGYLQYQDPAIKTAGSAWGTFAYALSLIVLFIGVIFFAYLSSRFLATKMGGIGHGAGTAIHTTLALGPNRNIHLVEMAGRFFVVGATEHSIQLLFELDSPEQIALIRDSANKGVPSFETALSNQMSALKQIRDRFPGMFSHPDGAGKNTDQEKR